MQWNTIRSKILALHRFDVQPKLKEKGLPSGLFVLPKLALELMIEELSPTAYKVFQILLSRLDYQLRTHWVTGISTIRLSELCRCRRAQIYQALDELKKKGYIYIVSGKKHQARARGIRRYVYGKAQKLGGNDYNAYSLLPFFVKLFMELDAQRLEEPDSGNPDLPPDEEVLKSCGLQKIPSTVVDTQGLEEPKNAGSVPDTSENPQEGGSPSSKPLGDNEKKDTFVYIDKPMSYRQTYVNKTTTNDIHTYDIHTYDTHTYRAAAEKNRATGDKAGENSAPAPADRLNELALNFLVAYLSRNENVRSPIAVLKSLTENQLEALACEVLNWFFTHYSSDWDLKSEVDRLINEHDCKCVELLEYVQLSEEGKVEWLKKKGIL